MRLLVETCQTIPIEIDIKLPYYFKVIEEHFSEYVKVVNNKEAVGIIKYIDKYIITFYSPIKIPEIYLTKPLYASSEEEYKGILDDMIKKVLA